MYELEKWLYHKTLLICTKVLCIMSICLMSWLRQLNHSFACICCSIIQYVIICIEWLTLLLFIWFDATYRSYFIHLTFRRKEHSGVCKYKLMITMVCLQIVLECMSLWHREVSFHTFLSSLCICTWLWALDRQTWDR